MKVSIKTLGCRLNWAESDQIANKLADLGVEITSVIRDDLDICIINSCCITEKAVTKSRREINKIRNSHKNTRILLCGCAQELKSEADFYVKDKNDIPEFIYNKFIKNKKLVHKKTSKLFNRERTRAFIKIQEGCDNFCAYCIIPYVRQKMFSIPYAQVLEEIKEKEELGFKEIVLTGVNIGKYKDKQLDLTGLVKKILEKTDVCRIRFGSINPESIDENFISLFTNKRVCNHLHLSLQSGSDNVLSKMRRNYTAEDYLNIVREIYREHPDFNFTTDVIVGFPGETEKDFLSTCNFVQEVNFSKIHIFRYSRREGTLAAQMDNQVKRREKKERALKLANIDLILGKNFKKKMLGKEEEILFEGKRKGYFYGFTNNYFRVKLKSKESLKNKIVILKINNNNLTI